MGPKSLEEVPPKLRSLLTGHLESVPMVAESEWGDIIAIKEDFQKLLVARATVRVMVFNAEAVDGGIAAVVNRLREMVGVFQATQAGDTFLLVAREYDEDEDEWKFSFTEILSSGPNKRPIVQEV